MKTCDNSLHFKLKPSKVPVIRVQVK